MTSLSFQTAMQKNEAERICLHLSSIGVGGTRPFSPEGIFVRDFLWWGYETVFYMMEQFDSMGGNSIFFNMMEPLNGKQLNKAREPILATERSEGASYALETKVQNLIDGTTS